MRQTVKEIEVNVAYRWFLGLEMMDKVPHFSTFGFWSADQKRFVYSLKHSPSQGCAFLILSLFLIFFPVVVELDQSDSASGAGLLIQRRNMPIEHRA